MPTNDHTTLAPGSSHGRKLLFVTDPVDDRENVLEFACELANRYRADLELCHVVDPDHSPSMPDGQTGIQYRLEALDRTVRRLKNGVQAILLFGKAEHVVSARAANIKATLIAVALNGSKTDRIQRRLARNLARECDCPVMALPPDIRVEDAPQLSELFRAKRGWLVKPNRLRWT
jgi:nucleotide-binding universal stress UspA family protein